MPSTSTAPVPSLKEQLVRESASMARRLVTNGVRVPPGLVQAADQFETALAHHRPIDMTALASTHDRLARLVSPAKPGTLYLLDTDFHQMGRDTSLGPVKVVRDLVKVAFGCVAVFILLSVLQLVEAHPDITLFNGHRYLVVRIILERVFWLSAAGIGASFAMLFQLNDQIVNRTYDPDETASYWVKFFLGLVAGFILVALVPIDPTTNSGAEALGPPTIALLGGFSASAVYRILTRMVEALESIFSGGAKEQAMAAEKAASIRANEEFSQGRMAVAGQLVELQQRLAAGMSPEEASSYLGKVVNALVPTAFEVPAGTQGPAAVPRDDPQPEPRSAPGRAQPEPEKVPALAVVSEAPQVDAVPADTTDRADSPAAAGAQPEERTPAVG